MELCQFLGLVVESVDDLAHALNGLEGRGVRLVRLGLIKHYQHSRTLVEDTCDTHEIP